MRSTYRLAWIPALLFLAACSGSGATTFVNPDYNFSYVERVAVIPFENLTDDQGAGARTTRYYVAELLATEAFDVVEPGEVKRVLEKYSLVRTSELTQEQAVSIGAELGAQGLFLGSVNESSTTRSGSTTKATVTLVVSLTETDTGTTVWSTTSTSSGGTFWSSLFGTGTKPMSEVARDCVDDSVGALVN